jgi:hypothetical protein
MQRFTRSGVMSFRGTSYRRKSSVVIWPVAGNAREDRPHHPFVEFFRTQDLLVALSLGLTAKRGI